MTVTAVQWIKLQIRLFDAFALIGGDFRASNNVSYHDHTKVLHHSFLRPNLPKPDEHETVDQYAFGFHR